MDFFDLLILSLLALPALIRWIEQSRKAEKGNGAPASTGTSEGRRTVRSEFERALEEIGLTMQGKPVPEPGSSRPADEFRERRAVEDSRESARGFTREEQFERTPRHKAVGAVPFRELKKVEIASPYSRRQTTIPQRTRRIRSRLTKSSTAREAVLLSEILGPPVALRRRGD